MDINVKWGYYTDRPRFCGFDLDLCVDKNYYKDLKTALKLYKIDGCECARVGLPGRDGGYVMLNNFSESSIAYSFGICDDVSWDNIMAEMGYDIYQYDHTINALPWYRKEFHWFKEGIAGTDTENEQLKSLKYFLDRNGHSDKKNMILKMDVEGAEWDFLETVTPEVLKQFDQIVFEMHNLVRSKDSKRILRLLKKLNKTHVLIHIHGNNCGVQLKMGNTIFPDVIETSYVSRDKYKISELESVSLPINLDFPNDRGRNDIVLGNWNEPLIID